MIKKYVRWGCQRQTGQAASLLVPGLTCSGVGRDVSDEISLHLFLVAPYFVPETVLPYELCLLTAAQVFATRGRILSLMTVACEPTSDRHPLLFVTMATSSCQSFFGSQHLLPNIGASSAVRMMQPGNYTRLEFWNSPCCPLTIGSDSPQTALAV